MNPNLKLNTILWNMHGIRENDKIRWYAQPGCVERMTEYSFFFGNGTGGSTGLIGKKYFFTKDEAIANFLKTHDSLTEDVGFGELDELLKDCVIEQPRSDWNDYVIIRDGLYDAGVYLGYFGNFTNMIDQIPWQHETDGEYFEDRITLKEIYEALNTRELITVFQTNPKNTEIFQCNNYDIGKWFCLGKVYGYA